MSGDFQSTERGAADLFLFAMAFIGFMVSVAGVIVSSVAAATLGALLFLVCLVGLRARVRAGD